MIRITQYPDFKLIDGFEIQMVGSYTIDEYDETICEPIVSKTTDEILADENLQEIFWSVYQHYDINKSENRGVLCLADCTTKKEAEDLMNHWQTTLELYTIVGIANKELNELVQSYKIKK